RPARPARARRRPGPRPPGRAAGPAAQAPLMRLVLATDNPDKAREIAQLMEGFELAPRPPIGEVDETGSTLRENAALKARALAEATGEPAVADDTGLEVDALGGAPGGG